MKVRRVKDGYEIKCSSNEEAEHYIAEINHEIKCMTYLYPRF